MTQTDLLVKENLAHDERSAKASLVRATNAYNVYMTALCPRCDHTLPDGTSANNNHPGNGGFGFWQCSICGAADF